ncbi:MAG: acyloxyacyl hydrolase [Pseudomonadota bacterium]
MRSVYLGLAALAAPVFANAQLEEVRVGVLQHNICVTDCKNANKEDGPNLEAEAVFAGPDAFRYLMSPRPYAIASVNTAGNTSYGGVGLVWTFDIARAWSFEPSLGYVIHDGRLESPFAQGSPESEAFAEENVFLGSRDLFRTGFALTRQIGDGVGVQFLFEHLSHGQILGNGRNQGLDNVGVRLVYTLGE